MQSWISFDPICDPNSDFIQKNKRFSRFIASKFPTKNLLFSRYFSGLWTKKKGSRGQKQKGTRVILMVKPSGERFVTTFYGQSFCSFKEIDKKRDKKKVSLERLKLKKNFWIAEWLSVCLSQNHTEKNTSEYL